jgi:hypothetical protein
MDKDYSAFPKAFYLNPGFSIQPTEENHFLQAPQSNLITNPTAKYITLDSATRNRTIWPTTSEFQIRTGTTYKNIQSIKLLSCIIPDTNNVLDEPYLLLQIKEIEGTYDAATTPCQNAFSKIYFQEAPGPDFFLRLDKGVGDPLTRVYWPTPKASIDRFTVSFRKYNGELFIFGNDNGPEIDPLLQTSITLEIRDVVPDVNKALGNRNI